MTLRPFFPYYGAKFRSAPRYPPPAHDWIVEPFAGSAGYALRYPDRQVLLVEASEPVAAIWRYLIMSRPRDILRLPLLEPGQSVDTLDLPQPARWLIGMWCNPGSAQPKKRLVQWHNPDGFERRFKLWGAPVRERIASQVERIAHWIVKRGTYGDAPNVRATWFVDPPYEGTGHYPHDASGIDFEHLGKWCRSRRGQVLVCEADGAQWLPFERFGPVKGKRRASVESLWTNGAP